VGVGWVCRVFCVVCVVEVGGLVVWVFGLGVLFFLGGCFF